MRPPCWDGEERDRVGEWQRISPGGGSVMAIATHPRHEVVCMQFEEELQPARTS